MNEIWIDGEYRPVVEAMRNPPSTIVDLGANIGLSIRFWKQHYPFATVLAVEPDSANMAMCRRNTEGLTGMTFVEACILGNSRPVKLDRSLGAWAFRVADPGADTSSQPPTNGMSMLKLLDQANITGPIDLLKCDIEGGEQELFGAGGSWINRISHMVVETHAPYAPPDLKNDISKWVAGLNYRVLCDAGSFAVVWITASKELH